MSFQRVKAGDDVEFRANEWNAMLGAGEAFTLDALSFTTQTLKRVDGVIMVKNTTGAARKQFDVVALGSTLLLDTAPAYVKSLAFAGVQPDPENNAAHRSRVAILLKPLAVDAIGPAIIRGQYVLPVQVIDIAHTRARVVTNNKLQSGYFGPVRILGARSTGDAKLCLCDVDGFDGGHCLAKVPGGGIATGTYAAPSTTTCTLAYMHPTTGAATDVTVSPSQIRVMHHGGAIAASVTYVQCRIICGRIEPDVAYC